MDSATVQYGTPITLPKCTYEREGYEFLAWTYDEGNDYEPGDSLTLYEDVTLMEKWEAVSMENQNLSAITKDDAFVEYNNSDGSSSEGVFATEQASPVASFPEKWSGTYLGTSSYVEGDHHISRAVAFHFTTVTDAGHLEGVCYVGTDDVGPGETYGTCYISGSID